jgi:hypothetical protein
MHGFCIFSGWGVGGGRKRPQNTVFWGPKRIHGVLRILAVFCSYSTESQNTQNTDRIRTMHSSGQNTSYSLRILCIRFWWTEYRILSKQQNTDRIRTEYGQNTVITKSPIVITKSTPPALIEPFSASKSNLTRRESLKLANSRRGEALRSLLLLFSPQVDRSYPEDDS